MLTCLTCICRSGFFNLYLNNECKWAWIILLFSEYHALIEYNIDCLLLDFAAYGCFLFLRTQRWLNKCFYYFSKIWNIYTLNITYLINKSFTNNTLIKKSLKWIKTKDISTWLKTKVSIRMQILEQLNLLALTGIHRLLMKLL